MLFIIRSFVSSEPQLWGLSPRAWIIRTLSDCTLIFFFWGGCTLKPRKVDIIFGTLTYVKSHISFRFDLFCIIAYKYTSRQWNVKNLVTSIALHAGLKWFPTVSRIHSAIRTLNIHFTRNFCPQNCRFPFLSWIRLFHRQIAHKNPFAMSQRL